MDKIKTVLDREPISSEAINSRQDFGKVLAGYKALKPSIWKSSWFYGTAGLATIAIVAAAVLYNPEAKQPVKDSVPLAKNEKVNVVDNIVMSTTSISNTHVAATIETETEVTQPKHQPKHENQAPAPIEVWPEFEEEKPPMEIVPEVKKPSGSINMMPNIAGYFNGEIPYQYLCGQEGIVVNDQLAVTSFTIQYYNGRESIEKTIKGNVIPLDLCENITKTSMNSMVFITQIKAEHRVSGRVTNLSSMNLTPTK